MSPEAKSQLKLATDAMETAVDAAYEAGKRAGIEIGVEQERGRLKKALFSDENGAVVVPPKPAIVPTPAMMAAGSLMQRARMMLAEDRKRSFSIINVIDYFNSHYRMQVTADQVRRVRRGVYAAGHDLKVQGTLLGGAGNE
jgi:hypothetical protein